MQMRGDYFIKGKWGHVIRGQDKGQAKTVASVEHCHFSQGHLSPPHA